MLGERLIESWLGLLNAAIDVALGSRKKTVLNQGRHTHDCARANVVTDLRRALTAVLGGHTRQDGTGIHYAEVAGDPEFESFTSCLVCLQAFDPGRLESDTERRAFWINLYNALSVDGIVRGDVTGGLRRRFAGFRRVQYIVSGLPFSLDDIEHGVLRGNRGHPSLPGPQFGPRDPRRRHVLPDVDPRLHMALNCAARSCPPIAAYDPARLDQQLDLASASFINGGAASYDPATDTLELSRIFKWYARDFGGQQGVQAFLRRYAQPPLREALAIDRMDRVRWQPYDWSVNA